ncbi:DUF7535 family protein [Haloarchaeobius sp. DFWS5]|uniref:DUF7535 family protein n=1 Tax=Haloarchaeobius sp. DFWS5 TaxID=3446114 RepID=UPI003EBC1451
MATAASAPDTPVTPESVPKKVLRTVTPPTGPHSDVDMSLIGWVMFGLLALLLLPVLPVIVLIWALEKVTELIRGR